MTNIRSMRLYALSIPFNVSFQHTTKDRDTGASVVVRLESSDGVVGYGEGAPRSYVTGESVDTCFQHLSEILWPLIQAADLPSGDDPDLLARIDALLNDEGDTSEVVAHHSARCAMELALLDLLTRTVGRSLGDVLTPALTEVQYSGVVSGGTMEKSLAHAQFMCQFGFQHFKAKVGADDTHERLRRIREVAGPDVGIRVDANEAWGEDEAIEILHQLESIGLDCAEQPVHRRDTESLVRIRSAVGVPIMVDESLVTREDALYLIEQGSCDYFNIRLSKCGGISRSLWMAERAREAGLGLQLGSHVGESAILAAAARHVAAHMADIRWVEGGWNSVLLKQDVSEEALGFGAQGRAPLLTGPGLGITVLDERLVAFADRMAEKTAD